MAIRTVLRTPQAAEYVGLAADTLEKMRRQGRGPAYIRLGPRAIGYHTRDLEKWLDRNRAVIPEHADTVARGD